MTIEEKIQIAKELIKKSDALLITAGAGMGVDSGLPDFRGNEGFWNAYPVVRNLGYSFSEMANPQWFESNPALAWAFYGHRLHLYRDTLPHDGFGMLLDLVTLKNQNYFIFTSNIDGQFKKAGFHEDKIVECHGSIHHFQCTQDCSGDIWDSKGENIAIDKEKFEALNFSFCPHCNAIARPNILMFADWGWNGSRTSAQENRYDNWLNSVVSKGQKLVIIEIGAGTAVPTVRLEGENIAKQYKNAKLIRINPREDQITADIGIGLNLGGLEGIEAIV